MKFTAFKKLDLGNNESLAVGICESSNGFTAVTFAKSKSFKTYSGAEKFLNRLGYVDPLTLFGGYELGKTYFCNYWRANHTITAVHPANDKRGWYVTSTWDDGHTTTHCTALDKRDKIVHPS